MEELILMTDYLQRRRFFKKNARKIIYSDWLSQVFVFAVLFVTLAGLSSIYSALMTLCFEIADNYLVSYMMSVCYIFFTVAFVTALVYGIIRFEVLSFEQKNPAVSDVFEVFSSSYMLERAYKTMFSFVIRIVPAFVFPFALSRFIGSNLYYKLFRSDITVGNIDVVYLSFNILLLVLVFLAFSVSGKHVVGLFYAVKNSDAPVGMCFKNSGKACFGYTTELFLMMFSFVPLIVVSLFTMGVAFIVYTLPYMLLTFAGMSEFLDMKKISLDDERI